MKRIFAFSVLLWLLMFAASRVVAAATWTVPSQKLTIKDALDAASAGDYIEFSDNYTEYGMVTVNKSVTIHNPNAKNVKIIAQGNDPYAVKVTATGVLIDGLTLEGGKDACLNILGTGGGTVSNCTLSPVVQTNYGAMLYGSDAILEESTWGPAATPVLNYFLKPSCASVR
jgi:hypothetical protein